MRGQGREWAGRAIVKKLSSSSWGGGEMKCEMDGKSSTHGGHEKCIQHFSGETLTEETCEGVDRIQLGF
jgi:hypothetical protein